MGGSLAGGVSVLLDQVRWLVCDLGIALPDAVRAAATTPARALALDAVGTLLPGLRADLVVVDDDLSLHGVMRGGDWLEPPCASPPPRFEVNTPGIPARLPRTKGTRGEAPAPTGTGPPPDGGGPVRCCD